MTREGMPEPQLVPAGQGQVLQFDWGEITWMVSGEQGNSAGMTFGRVVIHSGCANPYHAHPNCEEVLYLLSGELVHAVGDQSFMMRAGDTITIPCGARHRAAAVGNEDAVMLVAYNTAFRQVSGE